MVEIKCKRQCVYCIVASKAFVTSSVHCALFWEMQARYPGKGHFPLTHPTLLRPLSAFSCSDCDPCVATLMSSQDLKSTGQ